MEKVLSHLKKDNVIRLEKKNTRMVGWMCNIKPEDITFAEEVRTRLKLNRIRECLQEKRLQWFTMHEEWKRMFGLVNVEP